MNKIPYKSARDSVSAHGDDDGDQGDDSDVLEEQEREAEKWARHVFLKPFNSRREGDEQEEDDDDDASNSSTRGEEDSEGTEEGRTQPGEDSSDSHPVEGHAGVGADRENSHDNGIGASHTQRDSSGDGKKPSAGKTPWREDDAIDHFYSPSNNPFSARKDYFGIYNESIYLDSLSHSCDQALANSFKPQPLNNDLLPISSTNAETATKHSISSNQLNIYLSSRRDFQQALSERHDPQCTNTPTLSGSSSLHLHPWTETVMRLLLLNNLLIQDQPTGSNESHPV